MKKIISLILSIVLIFSFFGCSSSNSDDTSDKKYNIAYITDTDGKKSSINKLIIQGIEDSFDGMDYNLDVKEPDSSDDYESIALKTLSSSKNYDLVIANSNGVCTALLSHSSDYQDVKLGFIGYKDDTNNSMSLSLKKQEGAFLAGALAALSTKSNVVGYVGAYENKNEEYLYGFKAGVKSINKKVKVITEYTDSYIAATKAAKKTESMYKKKTDVIFTVCGASAIGVNSIVSKYNLKVIDSDLYNETDNDIKLGEVYINYKNVVATICDSVIYNSFKKQVVNIGVSENVMDISLYDDNINNKDKVEKKINGLKKSIATEKIKVPMSKKAYDAF